MNFLWFKLWYVVYFVFRDHNTYNRIFYYNRNGI